MGDDFTECSTGILVDIEDNELDKNLPLLTLNTDEPENYSASGFSSLQGISSNKHLGAELNARREMFITPKRGWKTPSPKSMKMISKEATRIIDQLYASPIDTIEPQLIDEDFPTPFSLDGCSSESSPESENICKKCAHSGTNQRTISKDFCVTVDGCNNESPNQNESPNAKDSEVFIQVEVTEDNGFKNSLVSSDLEKKSPIKDILVDLKDSCVTVDGCNNESPNQNEIESLNAKESEVFTQVEVTEDKGSKNSLDSSDLEPKSPIKNEIEIPIKSNKYLGKENVYNKKDTATGMRFLPNKVSAKKNLGETNLGQKVVKNKSVLEKLSEKDCKAVISEKISASKKVIPQNTGKPNKINSVLPKLANTMPCLPSFSRKQSTNTEPSSKVVTPVPKFVRRTSSFQSGCGKYGLKNSETSFDTSFSAKTIHNRVGSTKKDSNNTLGKTRLSISQIPGNSGNPKYTPVSRSKSFPKSSATLSSYVSRPSLSFSARKIDSTSQHDQLSNHNRPAISTSSRIRFTSRLCLPSPLPDAMNISLPRKLFSDVKTIKKR